MTKPVTFETAGQYLGYFVRQAGDEPTACLYRRLRLGYEIMAGSMEELRLRAEIAFPGMKLGGFIDPDADPKTGPAYFRAWPDVPAEAVRVSTNDEGYEWKITAEGCGSVVPTGTYRQAESVLREMGFRFDRCLVQRGPVETWSVRDLAV